MTRGLAWPVGLAVFAAVVVSALSAAADGSTTPNPGGLPAPPPSARSLAIEIVSGNYGHNGSLGRCLVTQSVSASCNGKSRCFLNVEDRLCRPPGVLPTELILTLTVEYKCAPIATLRVATADKPFRLVIDCGASTR